VEVVVATCSRNGRPSPGYRGDVGDGTVKDPGSYGGRVIPCSRCASIIPLFDRRRSRPGWDVAEGVDKEQIRPDPRKHGT
jgi:hypothetical protein